MKYRGIKRAVGEMRRDRHLAWRVYVSAKTRGVWATSYPTLQSWTRDNGVDVVQVLARDAHGQTDYTMADIRAACDRALAEHDAMRSLRKEV